jgi:hypothetical protein
MLSAIGNAPAASLLPATGLDVQLARLQTQLADWVNCPSCKTPEGKAKIAGINAQIKDVELRMQAKEQAARPVQASASPDAAPPPGLLGGQIDVFV